MKKSEKGEEEFVAVVVKVFLGTISLYLTLCR